MAELLQTTLCYLEQNGCYLMLHRIKKKNDVNHDKWIGVGGKFAPGETAEACALREVWEETGLTMQSPAYRGIVDFTCEPWPAERMHLYTCTDFTGTLTDCNEGTLEWVPKPEVEKPADLAGGQNFPSAVGGGRTVFPSGANLSRRYPGAGGAGRRDTALRLNSHYNKEHVQFFGLSPKTHMLLFLLVISAARNVPAHSRCRSYPHRW